MSRLTLILLAVLFQACGPITFTTTVAGQGSIQGSQLGALLNVFPAIGGFGNIDFAQNQDFQNNKTSREMVRSVKVTSLTARITDPAAADFGFIDSLELTAKGATSEAIFAKKTGIPQAATPPPNATVTFDLLDVDLAPYVKEPSMSLVLTGKGRQPSQNTTIEVTVKLLIGASL
ncbi:MAG: hypothetical protein Q8L14_03420 [Myxococcales bacterium]|nr:hypothetical protein [Myxococcales bacterium]